MRDQVKHIRNHLGDCQVDFVSRMWIGELANWGN